MEFNENSYLRKQFFFLPFLCCHKMYFQLKTDLKHSTLLKNAIPNFKKCQEKNGRKLYFKFMGGLFPEK